MRALMILLDMVLLTAGLITVWDSWRNPLVWLLVGFVSIGWYTAGGPALWRFGRNHHGHDER